jgi:2,3-bisphosphoglycerate-independent phosphoglycerate mutase
MDELAGKGECGIMDPIAPGIRAGSDTAHLALLGYDPYSIYTGRGPFEAMGIGMEVKEGDIAFRCNFATVDENFIVVDRRAGRIEEGTKELAEALNGIKIEDVTCFIKESVAHRAALILRGKDLGERISDIDPHREGEKIKESIDLDGKSEKTARILNKFVKKSYEILKEHPLNLERIKKGKNPANIILPRGGGAAPSLENFQKKYNLKSACIVEVGLIKGIARYIGMDVIDVEKSTGGLDTDVFSLGDALISAVKNYDFILFNIKGCDVAGHDGNFKAKVEFIEKIDSMIGYILKHLPDDLYLCFTADHSTPVSVKDHSGDPVPIVFAGPGVRRDDVKKFDERSTTKGGIGRIRGKDVLNILTNLAGIQEKFGA